MFKYYWQHYSYIFWHWFFSWNQDEEGDLTFSIARMIHFTKYKEHTTVHFFNSKKFTPAPKYVSGEK